MKEGGAFASICTWTRTYPDSYITYPESYISKHTTHNEVRKGITLASICTWTWSVPSKSPRDNLCIRVSPAAERTRSLLTTYWSKST
jgi:hypothetical protein